MTHIIQLGYTDSIHGQTDHKARLHQGMPKTGRGHIHLIQEWPGASTWRTSCSLKTTKYLLEHDED